MPTYIIIVFLLLGLLMSALFYGDGSPLLAAEAAITDGFSEDDVVVAMHQNFMNPKQLEHLRRKVREGGQWSHHHHQHQNRQLQVGDTIDELFDNRQSIMRIVEPTDVGVLTTTTSNDEYVVGILQKHVTEMKNLNGQRIRQGDPLFVALFDNIEQTEMEIEFIDDGVRVKNTATTDCGKLLVEDHATQVSRFVTTGIRRPNFNWQTPVECDDPQPLLINTSATMTPAPDTQSTTMAPSTSSPTMTTMTATPTTMTGMPTTATNATTTAPQGNASTLNPTTMMPTTRMPTTTTTPSPTTTAPSQTSTGTSSPTTTTTTADNTAESSQARSDSSSYNSAWSLLLCTTTVTLSLLRL